MEKTNERKALKGPIDPFMDWGFKYLFGREESKDLLKGFLNLLLMPDVPIQSLVYLNTEVVADRPDEKRCRFDVLCSDERGDKYLIEMQNASDLDIRPRLTYYVCRLVDRMSRRGKKWNYGKIKRAYAICLMNFTYEKDPLLRRDIMLRDTRDGKPFTDILNIITLQIPCIQAKSLEECRESYEMLLFLLQAMNKGMETEEELLAEIDGINLPESTKALFRRIVTTDIDSLSEKEFDEYEIERDYYIRTMSEFRTARIEGHAEGHAEGRAEGLAEGRAEGWAEGRAEGREEGRKEGRAEGREEGREEGRAEGRAEGLVEGRAEEQRKIAKALKEHGAEMTLIAQSTGLSEDEIRAL